MMTHSMNVTSLDGQWGELCQITREVIIERHSDRDLAVKYIHMFNTLRHDQVYSDTILGMYRAPASRNRHHAIEGGLVRHLLEMWQIWNLYIMPMVQSCERLHPSCSPSNVWRAIVHHDLNKIYRYRLVSEHPWQVDYSKQDRLNDMLGSTHKSLSLINRFDIPLSELMHNALITAEGGFSETQPRVSSIMAKIVYILDELSANVLDRVTNGLFYDSAIGGWDAKERTESN